jgi:MFS family permease
MNPDSRNVARKYFGLSVSRSFAFALADTFIILYILANLGYKEFGMILAVRFGLQAILDYPTGVLGDIVGQKKVLTAAYMFHIVSLVTIILAENFNDFLIYVIISAIANSQESGALQSWFDTNYRITSGDTDPKKTIFGAFNGKAMSLYVLARVTAYFIGGIISTNFSRVDLFRLELVAVAIVFGAIIKNVSGSRSRTKNLTIKTYCRQLAKGIEFFTSTRGVFFYLFGLTLISGMTIGIWSQLILLPLYEDYAGNDVFLAIFRGILVFTGFLWMSFLSKFTKKISRTYSIVFGSTFIGYPVFFLLVYLHYIFIPPQNEIQLHSSTTIFILFQIVGITMLFQNVFNNRVQIQLIPNEIRNSIYSLIPTLMTMFGLFFAYFGGLFMSDHKFEDGILLLSGLTTVGSIITGIGLYLLSKVKEEEIEEYLIEIGGTEVKKEKEIAALAVTG